MNFKKKLKGHLEKKVINKLQKECLQHIIINKLQIIIRNLIVIMKINCNNNKIYHKAMKV